MRIWIAGRTRARSQALQLLFQAELQNATVAQVLAEGYVLSDGPLDEYADELARGTDAFMAVADEMISRYLVDWTLQRLSTVDRGLLRLSLYEMCNQEDVDYAVTINETVELAKAFGGDDSPSFINGILGRITQDLEAHTGVVELLNEQHPLRVSLA